MQYSSYNDTLSKTVESAIVTFCANAGNHRESNQSLLVNESNAEFAVAATAAAAGEDDELYAVKSVLDCFNNSLTDSLRLPLQLRTTATIICLFVLILGLTGNVLVPYVVFYTKELRNSTNLFLINLSIADLLVLVVCMPTVLFELHSKPEVWVLGEVMCKVVPFVEMTVAHGSILTMIAISFERYYAICKPLKAGYKCTKFRALIIIVCVWTVSITTTTPVLIIAEQTEATYIDGTRVNVCLTQASATWQKVYFVTTTAAFFWSPLCILIVIYVIIAKRLCLDDNRTANLVHHHAECVQMRARRQVVFMLAAVIACFFICLLPFRLLTIWLIFSTYDQIKSIGMEAYYTLLYICRIMLYLNSAINPILYNVISSKFRDAFVSALRCKRPNRILMRQSTFTTTNSSVLMSSLKNSLHLVPSHQSTQSSAKPIVAALKNDNCVKNVCETESGECQQNLLFHNLSILSPEESYV